jgi:hypothetical protein
MAQLSDLRRPFRALVTVFIPETASAGESAWLRLEEIATEALATRPAAIRRQVFLFIRFLDGLALVRRRRRLADLDPASRAALVEGIATSRLLLFRRGVWGLRTLAQMGWYTQAEVQRALGYRASAAGWEAPR